MDAGQKGCSLKCAGAPHRGRQLPDLKDEKRFETWKCQVRGGSMRDSQVRGGDSN